MRHHGIVLTACLVLFPAVRGMAPPKAPPKPKPRPPIGRFVWQTHRIRSAGAIDGRVTISRRTILLKCDTVTGRMWRYKVIEEDPREPEEGEEPKTFTRIPVQDLETDQPEKKEADKDAPPRCDRAQSPQPIQREYTCGSPRHREQFYVHVIRCRWNRTPPERDRLRQDTTRLCNLSAGRSRGISP